MSDWYAFGVQAAIVILVPTLIGAGIAILRHLVLGTYQSTVDFLVVLFALSLAMLFWPSGLSGLYGATPTTFELPGMQNFAMTSGVAAVFGVLVSIMWLEPMYNEFPRMEPWQRQSTYRLWLAGLAATAALFSLHITFAAWPSLLSQYPWDILRW